MTILVRKRGRLASSDPDYPIGKTAAAIWIDTNIPLSTNASRVGYAGFDISAPASPFSPLATRLFAQLVGNAFYHSSTMYSLNTRMGQDPLSYPAPILDQLCVCAGGERGTRPHGSPWRPDRDACLVQEFHLF